MTRTFFATLILASAWMSSAQAHEIQNHALSEQKLTSMIATIDELSSLKSAGFSSDEIMHMQHLLLQKVTHSHPQQDTALDHTSHIIAQL